MIPDECLCSSPANVHQPWRHDSVCVAVVCQLWNKHYLDTSCNHVDPIVCMCVGMHVDIYVYRIHAHPCILASLEVVLRSPELDLILVATPCRMACCIQSAMAPGLEGATVNIMVGRAILKDGTRLLHRGSFKALTKGSMSFWSANNVDRSSDILGRFHRARAYATDC